MTDTLTLNSICQRNNITTICCLNIHIAWLLIIRIIPGKLCKLGKTKEIKLLGKTDVFEPLAEP